MIGQTPSIEHYKSLWMAQNFAGPSEKFDHEVAFDAWAAAVKAEAAAEALEDAASAFRPGDSNPWAHHVRARLRKHALYIRRDAGLGGDGRG